MEAFEAVRRAAADLHDRTIAAGADPWVPEQLVSVAAGLLDCTIQDVPLGDPYLRGGRGVYDPELRLILREAEAPAVEKALLAGHELGHAHLHDTGEVVVTSDIDPSRAVDAGESAIDRLAGYGRRERREVQMDLFAREFMLPRARARRLHLDEALGAAEIAARSGLPYALVAQQMLDALLLPPVELKEHEEKSVLLDESQERAASHGGSPFELQAGPGTGKTRTLVARVEKLVDAGVDPKTILVLTFSNKAAGELTERLARSRPHAASAIWAGTFHAFGLDVLRSFHDRLALPADPRVIEKADAIGLLEDLVPSLPLSHFRNLYDPTLDLGDMLSAISRAKDEVMDAAAYAALVKAMERQLPGDDEDAVKRVAKIREVAEVYRTYEAALEANRLLDFGDLVMKPVQLLERDAEVRTLLAERHQHVLVDEYQDVNRASVRLLQTLVGDGERLWTVGDSRQSVYRFRGASSSNMADFTRDFRGGQVDRLEVNYRSREEVVGTFTTFAATMKASEGVLPLKLDARNGRSGIQPAISVVQHPDDEAAAVAAAILELKETGIAFRDQAVLCRGNARLADIAEALEERDIPILYLGSLFERPEIKNLLALLSLLVDPKASGLAGVATMARYRLSLSDVARLVLHARDATAPLDWLEAAEEVVESEASRRSISHLRDDLGGFGSGSQPWQVLNSLLLDRLDTIRTLAVSDRPRDRVRAVALWQLLGFCRKQPSGQGLPIARMLDRVRRLVLLSDERDLRQMPSAAASMDAVQLMTVHGAKGLEWEAVHVAGMTTASFPSSAPPPRCLPPDGLIAGSDGLTGKEAVMLGKDEEEECLFFVALSRAKTHLRLYRAARMANGNNRSPSRFLGVVAQHLETIDRPVLLMPRRPDDGQDIIAISCQSAPSFTQEQIALYGSCRRRFFYTHILKLAGGRRTSPFAKLHDVVYWMIAWLRADPARWTPEREEVIAQFERSWAEKGPVESGYEADYRRAALELIDRLLKSREGAEFVAPAEIELDLEGLRIVVTPDEVRRIDTGYVLRRVRTGRLGSKELEDAIYALYHLAAERHYPGASIEVIHLGGDTVTPADYKPKVLENRKAKAASYAADIRRGYFPQDPDNRTCPRCPHFFACGCLPDGELRQP